MFVIRQYRINFSVFNVYYFLKFIFKTIYYFFFQAAVTVIVVFMTTVCNVYTENTTTYGTTENSTVTNATETESQVTQIVQNKDVNDSVKNNSEENQELSDRIQPIYSSAREIAKKNLYTLVKIHLLGHLLQRLPIEKRQSIFINALKKIGISGNERSDQNGKAKAFSMQHRRFDDSNDSGSGSKESTEENTDKSQKKDLLSDNKNQESFDQETEMQLQVIKHQVSNDVKDLLKTVFPGVDSNSQSASQGHYTHPTNHNQHSRDSDVASKEANSQYDTPVIHSVINPAQKQSTHPVYVPTHSFVSRSPYSEDHPLKQVRINGQLSPGTKQNRVLPASTTPFTIYQGPSLEVDPFKETLNLQPVTLNDYSAELPSAVTFLGENNHDKMSKSDVKDKEGNSELFGLSNSYDNDHTTQSKNDHIVENDLSNSSEEKSIDNHNYHTTSNLLNMNVYPSSDVQDYYEDNLLTADKTSVEEAVQMIYNLFNDYDDHVFDYENEKLNLDVELRPTTTLSPLVTTQGYTFRATESSFTAYPFITAENMSTVAEDKDGNNSRDSDEDVNTLKHDITYAPSHGSGEIRSMFQKKTETQKEGNDKPNSDNIRSQEMKEYKIESRDNHLHVENYGGTVTTQMYNTNNNVPDSSSSSEEMSSSNVVRRYQSQNGNRKPKELVKENENKENFSSEMEATLPPKIGKNLFPLSRYDANKKTSEYERIIDNDKSIHDSRQHHASDSKDSGSSGESTLYNLLEKPFFAHSKYGLSKKDNLGDERKFGFDSEEEYGRDGGDGSKEDSYEFILQENHILKSHQKQRSSPMVLAEYSNRKENNSQHKFSSSNELATSRSPDVYVGKNVLHFYKGNSVSKEDNEKKLPASGQSNENSSQEKDIGHVAKIVSENKTLKKITNSALPESNALFPLQDKNSLYKESVISSVSEGSNSDAQENNNSSPLGKLIGDEKRNGHHSSDESRSSMQIDEYEMKQLLRELDGNLNNIVNDAATYKPIHTSKDASSSEELRTEGLGKDSSYEHKLVSSSQSTENLSDGLLKEGNIISIDNENTESLISGVVKALDSDSNEKTNVHKDTSITESGSTDNVEKQQFEESDQNSDSSESLSPNHSDGGDSAIQIKHISKGAFSTEYGNKESEDVSCDGGICFSGMKSSESLKGDIDSHNTIEAINSADSTEDDKQFNENVHHQANDGEKIQNRNNNKSSMIFDSQSHENDDSLAIESKTLLNGIGNSKGASSSSEEQTDSIKKDISESTEKFKKDRIEEDTSNDKQEESSESQSTDHYEDLSVESIPNNKDDGSESAELENNISSPEHNNLDTASSSKNIDFKFTNDNSMFAESKEYASETNNHDSNSVSLVHENKINEKQMDSSGISHEELVDDSMDEGSISHQINKLFDVDSSLESKSVSEEKNDKDSFSTELKNHISSEENAISSDSSLEGNSILIDKADNLLSKDTEDDYNLPGDKSSSCEKHCESSSIEQDLFDKTESSENESSEQNIPINKDYLPEDKNSESEQVKTSAKINSSEKSGQTEASEENEDVKEETGKIDSNKKMHESKYVSNNADEKNSDESRQESKVFESEENISNDSEQAKNENPKIPEEPTPSSDEKKEETKLQYIIEKVFENEKRGQESGDVDDSEQTKNENPKNLSKETTENFSSEIPEDQTPSSDEKNEETKLQYIIEKVSGNEKSGQESGDVDNTENEQSHDYSKLIVEKSVFNANKHGDGGGNERESGEETTQKIIESSENGDNSKSEERDKIKVEKIQTNNGNSKENKNKQSHEILNEEPKSKENPEQKHESNEKNVNKAKHDPNGNSKENDQEKDDPAEENKKDKNEYQEDNKQKKSPNCDEKTNDENKNVDDDIRTKEIRNDNDLEKAVEMISDMFIFDFDGSNSKKHTHYVSGENINTESGYGKVGRVKSLIQKLVHLKKLWWKTKYGSKTSKSFSNSFYGSGDLSRLNMKLPTLKNNLYENSNRRTFYGKTSRSNFGSFPTYGSRQPYHQPSNYGSRDRYDRRSSAPYRPTLSKYLRGEKQIISSPLSSTRPSYGSRKLKISFGDSSNDYDKSHTGLSRLSGILTKKPRTGVYGSRIGYDDSVYSRHENVHSIDARVFDLVDDFTNNDEDVIVHPVVTKSNY